MDVERIAQIVNKVVNEIEQSGPSSSLAQTEAGTGWGVFDQMEDAINAAKTAQKQLADSTLEKRKEIIQAIRDVGFKNAEEVAHRTFSETGMGKVEHKIAKMQIASTKTPGIEDLESIAYSGDHGLTVDEMAPFGTIGAITPSTHPVPTLINNAISMISAGNSIVVNAHPGAKNVSNFGVQFLNKAIISVGGPANLITSVKIPTMDTGNTLFHHPKIDLLVITGGPGVVKAAMKAQKRAICAGPGNPPVVVDETADIANAARSIIASGSFDNNILCIGEKIIIAVSSIATDLKKEMVKQGCVELKLEQMDKLAKTVFMPETLDTIEPVAKRDFVGKDAYTLAKAIGLDVPKDTPLLIGETDRNHPFVGAEQMMCCIPMLRTNNVDDAIALAQKVEHGYRHTAIMHSKNVANLTKMGKVMDCTLFVKNGPATGGLGVDGEGHFTHSIASPTGEGITTARTFTRRRRCAMIDYLRVV